MFSTGNNCDKENQRVLKGISLDIRVQGDNHEIVILGDMNAHIEDFDGYTDTTCNLFWTYVRNMI